MLEQEITTLPQKTIVQGLVRELRERLLSGAIKAGEPLKQAQLAKQFGVSRIPVREALFQLDAEGLVKFLPHKGAIATELSYEEASELFHLRALLETDVLARAFDFLTPQDIDRAFVADAKYAKAIENGTEVDFWGELNWDFHRTLYEPANQPRTLAIIRNLHISTARYQRVQLWLTGGVPKAEAEHRAILHFCRTGNRVEAVNSLRKHILSVGIQIAGVFNKAE